MNIPAWTLEWEPAFITRPAGLNLRFQERRPPQLVAEAGLRSGTARFIARHKGEDGSGADMTITGQGGISITPLQLEQADWSRAEALEAVIEAMESGRE